MISQTAQEPTNTLPSENRERSRLLDHFKRVFAILVGLAITEACKKLLPVTPLIEMPGPAFWMFAMLLLTIIPIFHGGERSLDVRHLDAATNAPWRRLSFLWDAYVLLITGILFVCAAESLPHADVLPAGAPGADPRRQMIAFYTWMSIVFGFDVLALIVDYLKRGDLRQRLRSYGTWIGLNVLMLVVCVGAVAALRSHANLLAVSVIVCGLAALRTVLDYATSDAAFMFP